MKRIILLATILISAYSYAVDPVQGAVYAEIRGISGGRIRVYKGASFHSSRGTQYIVKYGILLYAF